MISTNPDIAAMNLELGISIESLQTRHLIEYQEASRLALAETSVDGKQHFLIPEAVNAWLDLKAAAHEDGICIFILSAFRSIRRQKEIIRGKLTAGISIEAILCVSAPPGFSEHHTGRAVDISTPESPILCVEFEQTPAFGWLCAHAGEFGFYLTYPAGNHFGYQYEPWHWCFNATQTNIKAI